MQHIKKQKQNKNLQSQKVRSAFEARDWEVYLFILFI